MKHTKWRNASIKSISRTVIGFKERSPILWGELNPWRWGMIAWVFAVSK